MGHEEAIESGRVQATRSSLRVATVARLHEALSRSAGLAAELGSRMDEAVARLPVAQPVNIPGWSARPDGRAVVITRTAGAPWDAVTLAEAARQTGRHPELLRRWCATGRLPARRVGRTWQIDRRQLAKVADIQARARPVRTPVEAGDRRQGD